MNTMFVPGVGNVFFKSNQPSAAQLATAQAMPGLMAMMPTHTAVMSSTCWDFYKIKPRQFDSEEFAQPHEQYGSVIDYGKVGSKGRTYDEALKAFEDANRTGDPEIDDKPDGMLVIALKSSMHPEQVEHAVHNTGHETERFVCLEYIGCESSSENWYPDEKYTSSKTAFTDREIEMIMLWMEGNRSSSAFTK